MGRKLILGGTKLTDTTAPRLPVVDPIESAGSLLLLDFTHPTRAAQTSIAHNAMFPNLMADNFKSLSPTAMTFDNQLNLTFGIDGPAHLIERSARGGLHVIPSQTAGNIADGTGARILAGADLRAYIKSRDGHPIYASLWGQITRPPKLTTSGTTSEDNVYFEIGNGSNSSQLAIMRHNDSGYPGTGNTILGEQPGALGQTTGPRRISFAAQGASTATTATPSNVGPEWAAAKFCYNNAVASWRDRAVYPSWICYRYYVEDLGVSGRTYAEVEAIDTELYNTEVLTPGGRYYGDTFTNPATKP